MSRSSPTATVAGPAHAACPVNYGHKAGADTLKARLRDAVEFGIEELTVYSFSTENWSRPIEEVAGTDLDARTAYRRRDTRTPSSRGAMRFIGRREASPGSLIKQMGWAEDADRRERRHDPVRRVQLRWTAEILDAATRFKGGTEEEFRRCLYAPEMHDPDLMIRTSGEQRLSNFLLWQAAYSELVFRDELWPDFTRKAFEESLAEFSERQRTFGGREPAKPRAKERATHHPSRQDMLYH